LNKCATFGILYRLNVSAGRAHFSVQLITISAVVTSKCAVERGDVCTKKCRDSNQNLCADYQVLYSCKSCLKYALSAGSEIVDFLIGRRGPHQVSLRAGCGPPAGRCAPLL